MSSLNVVLQGRPFASPPRILEKSRRRLKRNIPDGASARQASPSGQSTSACRRAHSQNFMGAFGAFPFPDMRRDCPIMPASGSEDIGERGRHLGCQASPSPARRSSLRIGLALGSLTLRRDLLPVARRTCQGAIQDQWRSVFPSPTCRPHCRSRPLSALRSIDARSFSLQVK